MWPEVAQKDYVCNVGAIPRPQTFKNGIETKLDYAEQAVNIGSFKLSLEGKLP